MPGAKNSLAQNGIATKLDDIVGRAKSVEGYLNRVLFRQYQKAQIERFRTENQSEGNRWQPLSPEYKKRKRIIYGGGPKFQWVGGPKPWTPAGAWPSYPGGGNVMMVATNKLMEGAIGRDSRAFTKVVRATGMSISINLGYVPYAAEAAAVRPVMEFSQDTLKKWHAGLLNFIMKGEGWATAAG